MTKAKISIAKTLTGVVIFSLVVTSLYLSVLLERAELEAYYFSRLALRLSYMAEEPIVSQTYLDNKLIESKKVLIEGKIMLYNDMNKTCKYGLRITRRRKDDYVIFIHNFSNILAILDNDLKIIGGNGLRTRPPTPLDNRDGDSGTDGPGTGKGTAIQSTGSAEN